jgi:AcrR family transcriptional regulator
MRRATKAAPNGQRKRTTKRVQPGINATGAVTRAKILKRAHDLYATVGYSAVTMRALAKKLGISAQALYYYFPSKEAMFGALAHEGVLLLEALHPSEELGDAIDSLRLPYLRYYEFSKAHRAYFSLLWMDPAAATILQTPQIPLLQRMKDDTHRRFQRCIDERIFPATLDIGNASAVLFGAVHGAAVLRLTGRPPSAARKADMIARTLLDHAISAMRAGAEGTAASARPRARRASGPPVVVDGPPVLTIQRRRWPTS